MLIDTHLHLSNENYDIDKVIKEANLNDVKILITGGTNPKNNVEDLKLAKEYKNIYVTLGYHPEYAETITKDDLDLLEQQINDNTLKVVGIGEIGLDYHYGKINKETQKNLFKKQIEIAKKYKLPVVIHSRDATEETYNILKESEIKGIIHCFSGSLEMAKKYLKIGFKLGIGGVVTFSNSNLKEIIKVISLDDIVLETDSPYLSPERGKKNEPQNIKMIATFVANLKNTSLEEVSNITTKNAKTIFNLGK